MDAYYKGCYELPFIGGTRGVDDLDSVQFTLEEGETLIGAVGYSKDYLDRLGFITRKLDDSTYTHGPVGGVGETDAVNFIVYQDILAFYGSAGWIIDRLGFYAEN